MTSVSFLNCYRLGLKLLSNRQLSPLATQPSVELLAPEEFTEPPSSPNIELISVHIPKTAGSTFRDCFLEHLYPDQVFYDYNSLNAEDTLLQIKSKAKVIHGHFAASKYKQCFPSAKLITWLRHPLSQRISWYFFWKTLPQTADDRHRFMLEQNLSFREFINLPYTSNNFANYLDGTALEEFYFIGVQEFFEQDLIELKHMLGLSNYRIQPKLSNANTHPNYQKLKQEILRDHELVKLLIEQNRQDLEIYRVALELRKKRRKRMMIDG